MSRVFLRRERILPGPLKVLQQPVRRSPVPVTPLSLAAAAIAAALLLMPGLAPRVSVDPTPIAEFAGASDGEPDAVVYAVSAFPAPVAEAAARSPAVTPASLAETAPPVAAQTGTPASARSAAAAAPRSAADMSLFQLDLLPALHDDVSDLDAAPPPSTIPQRAPARSPSRRAVAAKGAAPTQP